MTAVRFLAALALLAAAPSAAQQPADCDPKIEAALAVSAERGVRNDLVIVRHPEQGIRNPDSIFDFSCLEEMFDYRSFDVFFDPNRALQDLLGLARRGVCAAARQAYGRYVGRTPDATVYTRGAERLPGLDVRPAPGNVLRDVRPAAPRRAPPATSPPPASPNSGQFRSLIGGDR